MNILINIFIGFNAFVLLWVYYVAMMNLVRVYTIDKTKITLLGKIFGYYSGVIFLAADWTLNTLMTLVYFEIPKRKGELFTDRLIRWHDDEGYRGKFSRWFAHQFLDAYDHTGVHVKGKGH